MCYHRVEGVGLDILRETSNHPLTLVARPFPGNGYVVVAGGVHNLEAAGNDADRRRYYRLVQKLAQFVQAIKNNPVRSGARVWFARRAGKQQEDSISLFKPFDDAFAESEYFWSIQ